MTLFLTHLFLIWIQLASASQESIEKQLESIGSIPNSEVITVQREFTSKSLRHEFTPLIVGGIPFGSIKRTLFGSASYTLHANQWLGIEIFNFAYTRDFFTSFTTDINNNKDAGASQADIKPDIQKLLYFLTAGVQLTPTYGKLSSFSRWILYFEPYIALGGGLAKTETNAYLTFYPAVGFRAFFKEWFSMKLELRDYLYNESARGGTELRQNYALMLSLSFWLPKMPG